MCTVVENSLNVRHPRVSEARKWHAEKKGRTRGIGRGSGSTPGSFATVRGCHRTSPYRHSSSVIDKREGRSLHTQLPSIIHCQPRSHAHTHARMHAHAHARTHAGHGVTRARVSYERRGCVEFVQGNIRNKNKKVNRFRKHAGLKHANGTVFRCRRVNSNRSVGENAERCNIV